MANTNQSIRTCILKVDDLKCCSGCQKKACRKLQTISGVTGAEYNAEKGLMKIIGDVEPMTLVHKLTRGGKKAELVSVNYHLNNDDPSDDDEEEDIENISVETTSSRVPKTQKLTYTYKTKKKTGILRNSLSGCFSSKPKVDELFRMPNRNWLATSKFENGNPGFGGPRSNGRGSVKRSNSQYPPLNQMMPQKNPSMMQQQQQGLHFANHSNSQWQPPNHMMPQNPPMMQQQQQQGPHFAYHNYSQMAPPYPMMQQQQLQGPMAGQFYSVRD